MTSLVDVADFSAFQASEVDPEDPAVLLSLDAASEAVRRYCNRAFDASGETLDVVGTGTDTLLIPNPPLTAVTSVSETWGETVTELETTDYVVQEVPGAIVRILVPWYRASTYTVEYVSGFDDIPADVQMAVIRMASRLFVNSGGGTGEVEKVEIGTFAETYTTAASLALNGDEMSLVDSYRLLPVA